MARSATYNPNTGVVFIEGVGGFSVMSRSDADALAKEYGAIITTQAATTPAPSTPSTSSTYNPSYGATGWRPPKKEKLPPISTELQSIDPAAAQQQYEKKAAELKQAKRDLNEWVKTISKAPPESVWRYNNKDYSRYRMLEQLQSDIVNIEGLQGQVETNYKRFKKEYMSYETAKAMNEYSAAKETEYNKQFQGTFGPSEKYPVDVSISGTIKNQFEAWGNLAGAALPGALGRVAKSELTGFGEAAGVYVGGFEFPFTKGGRDILNAGTFASLEFLPSPPGLKFSMTAHPAFENLGKKIQWNFGVGETWRGKPEALVGAFAITVLTSNLPRVTWGEYYDPMIYATRSAKISETTRMSSVTAEGYKWTAQGVVETTTRPSWGFSKQVTYGDIQTVGLAKLRTPSPGLVSVNEPPVFDIVYQYSGVRSWASGNVGSIAKTSGWVGEAGGVVHGEYVARAGEGWTSNLISSVSAKVPTTGWDITLPGGAMRIFETPRTGGYFIGEQRAFTQRGVERLQYYGMSKPFEQPKGLFARFTGEKAATGTSEGAFAGLEKDLFLRNIYSRGTTSVTEATRMSTVIPPSTTTAARGGSASMAATAPLFTGGGVFTQATAPRSIGRFESGVVPKLGVGMGSFELPSTSLRIGQPSMLRVNVRQASRSGMSTTHLTAQSPGVAQANIPRVTTGQVPRTATIPRTTQLTVPRVTTATMPRTLTVPRVTTPGTPALGPPYTPTTTTKIFGGGRGLSLGRGMPSAKAPRASLWGKYAPSVLADVFKVRGPKPRGWATGLFLRPIGGLFRRKARRKR